MNLIIQRNPYSIISIRMSLGDTVAARIAEHRMRSLERDLDNIAADGNFIPWEEVKKELGF